MTSTTLRLAVLAAAFGALSLTAAPESSLMDFPGPSLINVIVRFEQNLDKLPG